LKRLSVILLIIIAWFYLAKPQDLTSAELTRSLCVAITLIAVVRAYPTPEGPEEDYAAALILEGLVCGLACGVMYMFNMTPPDYYPERIKGFGLLLVFGFFIYLCGVTFSKYLFKGLASLWHRLELD
jgi:hypothetical protein